MKTASVLSTTETSPKPISRRGKQKACGASFDWSADLEKFDKFIARPDVSKIYRRLHARAISDTYLIDALNEPDGQWVDFWNYLGGYRGLLGVCSAARDIKSLCSRAGCWNTSWVKYRIGFLYICVVASLIEGLVRVVLRDLPYLSSKFAVEIFDEIREGVHYNCEKTFGIATEARLFPTERGLSTGFYEREGLL